MEESFDYRDRPHDWLVKIVAGDIPSSPRHIAALYELERRKGRNARITSWVSIAIALVAIGVSVFREFDSRSETGATIFSIMTT